VNVEDYLQEEVKQRRRLIDVAEACIEQLLTWRSSLREAPSDEDFSLVVNRVDEILVLLDDLKHALMTPYSVLSWVT